MRKLNTYNIITYGCTFNQGDSLKIEKMLQDFGISKVNISNADILIINTCAVKLSTESKILDYISKLTQKYPSKFFIIAGCLPQIDIKINGKIKQMIENRGFILHPREIPQIIKLIFHSNNHSFQTYKQKSDIIPPFNIKSPITIIQISEGCNNNCSYCCTTISRGNLFSFSNKSIIKQIKFLISQGMKEFHITSQDLGNYNYNGIRLHNLLAEISQLKGDIHFRLGMINPDYIIEFYSQFLEIFNDKRFYRFLHIPIQSASNNVLKKMRRRYEIAEVESIFLKIKEYDQLFRIGTDIIVGFPNETEEDFDQTINFIKKWKPSILNISKYSVRPNTEAKKYHQLNSQVIKERSRKISKVFLKYSEILNKQWNGWKGDIFFNEYRENVQYPYMGRNLYYVPILCNKGTVGQSKKIKITGYLNHSLIGILL